jgi:hypothetical protein
VSIAGSHPSRTRLLLGTLISSRFSPEIPGGEYAVARVPFPRRGEIMSPNQPIRAPRRGFMARAFILSLIGAAAGAAAGWCATTPEIHQHGHDPSQDTPTFRGLSTRQG